MKNESISYELILSNRKTMAIVVKKDGTVVVKAPLHTKVTRINAFVNAHADWIKAKQSELADKFSKYEPIQLENNEIVYYMGNPLYIKRIKARSIDMEEDTGILYIPLTASPDTLINWYKKQALPVITDLVEEYARLMGLEGKYSSVKLSIAKSKWGSCSYDNKLLFSWRLIMCPTEVIEYVVVHELAHIIEKNHSKAFWNEVKKVLPDYREHRKWLKDNSGLMDLI